MRSVHVECKKERNFDDVIVKKEKNLLVAFFAWRLDRPELLA